MIDPLSIAMGLGGLVSTGLNVANTYSNNIAQAENLRYQKEQANLTRTREDNAIQRRVADLKAAGLSRTLAAGSASAASHPIRADAPQYKAPDLTGPILDLARLRADIDKTKMETEYIASQKRKADIDAEFMRQSNPLRLTGMDLQNRFSSSTLDTRVSMLKSELSGQDLRNLNTQLDNQLTDYHITGAKLDNFRKVIENKLAETNLTLQQKEILIKDAAIKLNKAITQGKENDNAWYLPDKIFEYIGNISGLINQYSQGGKKK